MSLLDLLDLSCPVNDKFFDLNINSNQSLTYWLNITDLELLDF